MDFVEKLTKEQRAQLLQIYTIERQDNQTAQVVAFAIIAAALTYVVASTAFLLGHCSSAGCKGLPPLVQLVSPLILLALLSFLVISVSATVMRAKHLRKLEELLGLEVSTGVVLPSVHRDSSDIWEVKFRPSMLQFTYVPLTLTTYIPMFLVALGYIVAVLTPGSWTWNKWLVAAAYAGVVAVQVAGLALPIFHSRFKTKYNLD